MATKKPRKITNVSGFARWVCPKCARSHQWEQQAAVCCSAATSGAYVGPATTTPIKTVFNLDGNHTGDSVNSPPHYKQGDIECIDAIQAALTEDEFRGYCKGNALKYIWRERHKGGEESLRKGWWYLSRWLGINTGA